MKKILTIYGIIFILFISFNSLSAAVTSTFQARAILKKLFSVSQTTPLSFGIIYVSPTAGGSVVLSTNNTITTSSGHNLAGGQTAGVYNVTGGNANAAIVISVTNPTLSNGSNTLSSTLSLASNTVTLNASGSGNIVLGGTLNIPANSASGTYSGNFNINIDYQ